MCIALFTCAKVRDKCASWSLIPGKIFTAINKTAALVNIYVFILSRHTTHQPRNNSEGGNTSSCYNTTVHRRSVMYNRHLQLQRGVRTIGRISRRLMPFLTSLAYGYSVNWMSYSSWSQRKITAGCHAFMPAMQASTSIPTWSIGTRCKFCTWLFVGALVGHLQRSLIAVIVGVIVNQTPHSTSVLVGGKNIF